MRRIDVKHFALLWQTLALVAIKYDPMIFTLDQSVSGLRSTEIA